MAKNLTHASVWRAFDCLAAKHGLSFRATAFNKSKRHRPNGQPHWPSTETIAKILAATGEPLADFIAYEKAGRRKSREKGRT